MRELIYVPIIHTEVDMGAMAESVKKEYSARYGRSGWQQHIKSIESMWDGVRRKIISLNLPYKKVRIYQDGLPVCGKEMEIVREIAGKGSRNHEIVLDMVMKGAKLEGTEDPALLLQEYKNFKQLYQYSDGSEKTKAINDYRKISDNLLIKRDKFIAKRIDNSLAEGEIGILFMGMQHTVDKYLKNIKISYLIHRLPFRESYETGLKGQNP